MMDRPLNRQAQRHPTRRSVVMAGSSLSLALSGTLALSTSPVDGLSSPRTPSTVVPRAVPSAATTAGDPLGEFQLDLLQQFPENYGGFFQNPDGTYSVVEVGENSSFESTAQALFDGTPKEFGVSVPAAELQLTFVPGSRTIRSLYAIMDRINASLASMSLADSQPAVFGTAIDQKEGQIVLLSDGSSAAAATVSGYSATYGSAIRAEVTPVPKLLANRSADTPPWWAGDMLDDDPETEPCTLGAGVHNVSTGQHFSLSAGHCGSGTWYNTNYADPKDNSSTLVGSTYPGSLAFSNESLDVQLIADDSQDVMWTGPVGSETPTTVDGDSNPIQGASVCLEGSQGGEICGTVTKANATLTANGVTTIDEFETNVHGVGGDSGGPVLYSTIFGNLVGGDIDAKSGSNGFAEQIVPLLFVESEAQGASVVIDTPSSP